MSNFCWCVLGNTAYCEHCPNNPNNKKFSLFKENSFNFLKKGNPTYDRPWSWTLYTCPNCGALLLVDKDQNFCYNCGVKLIKKEEEKELKIKYDLKNRKLKIKYE